MRMRLALPAVVTVLRWHAGIQVAHRPAWVVGIEAWVRLRLWLRLLLRLRLRLALPASVALLRWYALLPASVALLRRYEPWVWLRQRLINRVIIEIWCRGRAVCAQFFRHLDGRLIAERRPYEIQQQKWTAIYHPDVGMGRACRVSKANDSLHDPVCHNRILSSRAVSLWRPQFS
jgi:hypothetical protein